jgi:hypothetical protein
MFNAGRKLRRRLVSSPRPIIRSAKTPIALRSNNEISVRVHRKKQ